MSAPRNVATISAGRTPRCRMLNRLGDRCPNPALDEDPAVVQVCGRHAFEAARLLADAGVIRFQHANATTRRTK